MPIKIKEEEKIGFWENLRRGVMKKVNPEGLKRLQWEDNRQTDVKKAQDIAKSGGFFGRSPEDYAHYSEFKDLDEGTLADMLKLYKSEAKSTYTDLFKKESKSQGLFGKGTGWSFPILNAIKGSKHYKQYLKGLESGNIEALGFDEGIDGSTGGAFQTLHSSPWLDNGWDQTLERENTKFLGHQGLYGFAGDTPFRGSGKGWDLPMNAALMYMKTDNPKMMRGEIIDEERINSTIPSFIETLIHEGAHMPGKDLLGEVYQLRHEGDKQHLNQQSFWKSIIDASKYTFTKRKRKSGRKLIDKLIEDADNKVSGIDFMITDPKQNKLEKEYAKKRVEEVHKSWEAYKEYAKKRLEYNND
tara:strand:- start:189 stop:1259 length:1071 start_codon:yes stop_codon:yes gene_type:complete